MMYKVEHRTNKHKQSQLHLAVCLHYCYCRGGEVLLLYFIESLVQPSLHHDLHNYTIIASLKLNSQPGSWCNRVSTTFITKYQPHPLFLYQFKCKAKQKIIFKQANELNEFKLYRRPRASCMREITRIKSRVCEITTKTPYKRHTILYK